MMKKYLLPFLFIGTAIMIGVMLKTGEPLKSSAKYKNIVCLEFAYSQQKTTAIVNDWGTTNVAIAKINTYYDFIFLLFYSLFLFFTCDKIALINKSKLGVHIANGAIWAGLLDIFENAGMLYTLSDHQSNLIPLLTATAALIKFVLLGFAFVYLVIGIVSLIRQKKLALLLT